MARTRPAGKGELDPPPDDGYPTAYDIPAFKEMREQLGVMQMLVLVNPSMRGELDRLSAELDGIVRTVELFYERLGSRHWVFHGSLTLPPLRAALDSHDVDLAEDAVMSQYREVGKLDRELMRARTIPEMRERSELLSKAKRDYEEGRFYAVVLVLLTVIDGFVNDIGDRRRGLHTREGHELVAWNSVTAHHKGLAATQRSFTKRFNKTSADPIYELYRNGILHGNLTNFDNLVVASKAWNRLFALLDWAQALEQGKKPPTPVPTIQESLAKISATAERNERLENWTPRTLSAAQDGHDALMAEPVVRATEELLAAWRAQNFGRLAGFLHEVMRPKSRGAYIGQIRQRFEVSTLQAFDLRRVELRAAGCAHVWVDLTIDGATHPSEFRWLYLDADSHTQIEGDPSGTWKTVQTDPLSIVGRAW